MYLWIKKLAVKESHHAYLPSPSRQLGQVQATLRSLRVPVASVPLLSTAPPVGLVGSITVGVAALVTVAPCITCHFDRSSAVAEIISFHIAVHQFDQT